MDQNTIKTLNYCILLTKRNFFIICPNAACIQTKQEKVAFFPLGNWNTNNWDVTSLPSSTYDNNWSIVIIQSMVMNQKI